MPSDEIPDVLALPADEAQAIFHAANIKYKTSMAHPARHYFRIDNTQCYVIRQKMLQGIVYITLAAKQMPKEDK